VKSSRGVLEILPDKEKVAKSPSVATKEVIKFKRNIDLGVLN